MTGRIALTLLFVCVCGTWACGQTLILKADRLLDVRSGEVHSPGLVVVEGETISAVNPAQLPAVARTIDLGDRTLLPGLMDMHTHLTMDFTGAEWETAPVKETAADWALLGAASAEATLLAGFTTVRDVGSFRNFPDIALMRAIEKGLIKGPRIIPSGHALSITGGHCDLTGFAPEVMPEDPRFGIADGVDEVLKAVRYQIKHGARVIKVCATAGRHEGRGRLSDSLKGDPSTGPRPRTARSGGAFGPGASIGKIDSMAQNGVF